MTDSSRTGPTRDVPPPRPVPAPADVAPESGPVKAARLLADAVSGLLAARAATPDGRDDGRNGGRPAGPDAGPAGDGTRAAGSPLGDTLRDVAAAVASAAAAGRARAGRSEGSAGTGEQRGPGALLGDLLAAAAPRLPIRDAARLRAAYPNASDDEIADALVARAARLTAAVGAATGGLTAAQWFAPPSMLVLPLELAAETVLTAAVEVVLIGELHELHGRVPPGDARERAAAYLAGWSAQSAADRAGGTGMGTVLGAAAFRSLRRRLGRRMARSLPAAAPLLVGAALGGRGNRKATETLARRVRADLGRPLR